MTSDVVNAHDSREIVLRSLAKEIAMDIWPIETILENHGLGVEEWQSIQESSYFKMLLEDATRVWNAAASTYDRLKLKFQFNLEQSLPEMHARLHDPKEPLAAKVALFSALQKGAGLAVTEPSGGGNGVGGERFSLVINVGEGKETTIVAERRALPPVIDGVFEEQ